MPSDQISISWNMLHFYKYALKLQVRGRRDHKTLSGREGNKKAWQDFNLEAWLKFLNCTGEFLNFSSQNWVRSPKAKSKLALRKLFGRYWCVLLHYRTRTIWNHVLIHLQIKRNILWGGFSFCFSHSRQSQMRSCVQPRRSNCGFTTTLIFKSSSADPFWFRRALNMPGYGFSFYSKNTGMPYIMLSELPGELEAGTWWGKCL